MAGNTPIQDIFIGGINVDALGTPRKLQVIISGLTSIKKYRKAMTKDITKVVAFSIKRNISAGKRFDGRALVKSRSMQPIKGHTIPLMWSGQILSGVKDRMRGDVGIVEMSDAMYNDPRRHTGSGKKAPKTTAIQISKLASILHHGRHSYIPMRPRPFFGLSKWGRTQAQQIVRDYVNKHLQK